MLPFGAVEEWLMEAGRQVPALLILAYIVIHVLRHISEAGKRCDEATVKLVERFTVTIDKANEKTVESTAHMTSAVKEVTAAHVASIERLTESGKLHQEKVQTSLDRNTEAMGRNTEALSYHARAIAHDATKQMTTKKPGGSTQ